ncbi:unnamed protein product, partial [Mesorhabditis belari]|uniref:Uncharacterized protein n=1 Tax=Mesorhabditis belari TaxID=2138241 RepID=A0AAF3EJ62_9BILA
MPHLNAVGMEMLKRTLRRRGADSPPVLRRRSASVGGTPVVAEEENVEEPVVAAVVSPVVSPVRVARAVRAPARRGRGGAGRRGRRGGVAASSRTRSPVRAPKPRPPHDPAATPERIRRLARISIVLQLIALMTGSNNPWSLVRECFFSALTLGFDRVNGKKIAAEAKKIKVSKAILGLRQKKNRGNEHFIRTPFNRNIRVRDLVDQLEGPLVDTLNGWKLLCVFAKQLIAHVRLLIVEAKVFSVKRQDHCMACIQTFVDDPNIMGELDKWFEEGQGDELIVTIRHQLAMMEKNLAVGWATGMEEPGEEIDSDIESSDSSDSSSDDSTASDLL